MNRPALRAVVMLALASILLTACSSENIPGIDEFFKQMFYLATELVDKLKGVLSYFLVLELPAFVLGAKAILGGDKPDWGEALHWLGVMLGIALFTRMLAIFTLIGRNYFYPAELDYTRLVNSIGLPDKGWWRDIITWVLWLIPVFNAFWEFMLLAGYGISILVTVFVRNTKPLSLFAVSLLGWLLYPPVLLGLSIVTEVLKTYPPFEKLTVGIGPLFVVTAGLVGLAMYTLPGLFASVFAVVFPSKFPAYSWKDEQEAKQREDNIVVNITGRIFELLGALGILGPTDLPPRPPKDSTIYGNPPKRPGLPGGEGFQGGPSQPKGSPRPNGQKPGGNGPGDKPMNGTTGNGDNLAGGPSGSHNDPNKGPGPGEEEAGVAEGESFTSHDARSQKASKGASAVEETAGESFTGKADDESHIPGNNAAGVAAVVSTVETVDSKESLVQPNGSRSEDNLRKNQATEDGGTHITMASSNGDEKTSVPESGEELLSGKNSTEAELQTHSSPKSVNSEVSESEEALTQPANSSVVSKVTKVATYASVVSGQPEIMVAADLVEGADQVLRETGLDQMDPVRQVPGRMRQAFIRVSESLRGPRSASGSKPNRQLKKSPIRKEDEAFR